MPKLPKEVLKILYKLNFRLIRKSGSHKFLRHQDGRTTLIPYHGGRK